MSSIDLHAELSKLDNITDEKNINFNLTTLINIEKTLLKYIKQEKQYKGHYKRLSQHFVIYLTALSLKIETTSLFALLKTIKEKYRIFNKIINFIVVELAIIVQGQS